MNYIEENMRKRYGRDLDDDDKKDEPWDPQAELYRVEPIFSSISKPEPVKPASTAADAKKKKSNEEGSVTNSTGMLTAIPEVDLGMEYVITPPFGFISWRLARVFVTSRIRRKPSARWPIRRRIAHA